MAIPISRAFRVVPLLLYAELLSIQKLLLHCLLELLLLGADLLLVLLLSLFLGALLVLTLLVHRELLTGFLGTCDAIVLRLVDIFDRSSELNVL